MLKGRIHNPNLGLVAFPNNLEMPTVEKYETLYASIIPIFRFLAFPNYLDMPQLKRHSEKLSVLIANFRLPVLLSKYLNRYNQQSCLYY